MISKYLKARFGKIEEKGFDFSVMKLFKCVKSITKPF